MKVKDYDNECLSKCNFGDKRLTARALHIQDHLRVKYGQPLSKVFQNASDLKRVYEFLANSRTSFKKVVEPSHHGCGQKSLVIANGDRQPRAEKIDKNDNHARRESSLTITEETRLSH